MISRNPYFSGFSLAMMLTELTALLGLTSRNPYFSGFSLAILCIENINNVYSYVAILILVDFPLQSVQSH